MWVRIIDDDLTGPYVIPKHLNGHSYLLFLRSQFPALLENVPLAARRAIYDMETILPVSRRYLSQSMDWILGTAATVPRPQPLGLLFVGTHESSRVQRSCSECYTLRIRIIDR